MKIDLTENFIYEIEEMLTKMQEIAKKEERAFLKQSAEIVKLKVTNHLPRSNDEDLKNYDKTKPRVHMKDDIKVSVRKDKDGNLYAKIQGGKYTGYKWRFLNDGTIDNRGNIHNIASHFIEKSLEESKNEINAELDKLAERIVNNGE